MQIEMEKIVREGGALDASIQLGALDWELGNKIKVSSTALKGWLVKAGRGFDLEASLQSALTMDCVRCLETFELDLSFEFHLLFAPSETLPGASEKDLQGADCDSYPCCGGKVDLGPVVREQIYLHLPLKPVCEESCRGLCSSCGENLNLRPCACGEPARVRVI